MQTIFFSTTWQSDQASSGKEDSMLLQPSSLNNTLTMKPCRI